MGAIETIPREESVNIPPEIQPFVDAGMIPKNFYDELPGARVLYRLKNLEEVTTRTPFGQAPHGKISQEINPEKPRWIESTHVLGKGGLGEVHKGLDLTLQLEVAIKRLHLRIQSASLRQSFIREAQVMARFEHPHIPKVYDITVDNGEIKIIMEKVPGEYSNLSLERGNMSGKAFLRAMTEIAKVIDDGAKQNLYHFDLKPGNIMVNPEGHVKVLDFGLSSLAYGDLLGSGVGTINYMSPERFSKDFSTEKYAYASEIFSFSLVIYEMITGKKRFPGDYNDDPVPLLGSIISVEPLTPEQEDEFLQKAKEMGFNGDAVLDALEAAWTRTPEARKEKYATAADLAVAIVQAYKS